MSWLSHFPEDLGGKGKHYVVLRSDVGTKVSLFDRFDGVHLNWFEVNNAIRSS